MSGLKVNHLVIWFGNLEANRSIIRIPIFSYNLRYYWVWFPLWEVIAATRLPFCCLCTEYIVRTNCLVILYIKSVRVVHIRAIWCTSHSKPKKTKTHLPEKKFIIFLGSELLSSIIKKILILFKKKAFFIISQKKAYLIFPKMEPCNFQPKP